MLKIAVDFSYKDNCKSEVALFQERNKKSHVDAYRFEQKVTKEKLAEKVLAVDATNNQKNYL